MAHPDDLEYGASGAVAAWTSEGREIAYVIVTRGEAGIDGIVPDQAGLLREAEQRAGAAEVGVHTVEFLDHRDGVIEYGVPLRRDLARAIRRHRPELIVTLNHHDSWGPVHAFFPAVWMQTAPKQSPNYRSLHPDCRNSREYLCVRPGT